MPEDVVKRGSSLGSIAMRCSDACATRGSRCDPTRDTHCMAVLVNPFCNAQGISEPFSLSRSLPYQSLSFGESIAVQRKTWREREFTSGSGLPGLCTTPSSRGASPAKLTTRTDSISLEYRFSRTLRCAVTLRVTACHILGCVQRTRGAASQSIASHRSEVAIVCQ